MKILTKKEKSKRTQKEFNRTTLDFVVKNNIMSMLCIKTAAAWNVNEQHMCFKILQSISEIVNFKNIRQHS